LHGLHRRLRRTRWPDDFGNDSWTNGVERAWLEEMVAYGAGEFDWRAQESKINALSQYRVVIDDITDSLHPRARAADQAFGAGPDAWFALDILGLEGRNPPARGSRAHGGDPRTHSTS
jgi:Epoxide hydrolase N terminus